MKNWKSRPALFCALLLIVAQARAADGMMELNLRARVSAGTKFAVVEKKASWEAKKTALIICDMWDDHWCKSAARRVAEMAGPLNEAVKNAPAGAWLIIK